MTRADKIRGYDLPEMVSFVFEIHDSKLICETCAYDTNTCHGIDCEEGIKKTLENGLMDKIRKMRDIQLADYICYASNYPCDHCVKKDHKCIEDNCQLQILQWLRKEAE